LRDYINSIINIYREYEHKLKNIVDAECVSKKIFKMGELK